MRVKVKRLQLEFRWHQEALIHCVDRIDERLLRCRNQADEYKKTVSVLIGLNERLANLGEDPVQLSLHVGFSSPGDLILVKSET